MWTAIINKYNREGNFAIIDAACTFKTKREAIDMVRNNWGRHGHLRYPETTQRVRGPRQS